MELSALQCWEDKITVHNLSRKWDVEDEVNQMQSKYYKDYNLALNWFALFLNWGGLPLLYPTTSQMIGYIFFFRLRCHHLEPLKFPHSMSYTHSILYRNIKKQDKADVSRCAFLYVYPAGISGLNESKEKHYFLQATVRLRAYFSTEMMETKANWMTSLKC